MLEASSGWRPAAFNDGWTYRDRISAADLGTAAGTIARWYAARYPHSDVAVWRQRLTAGQIWRNGQQLWGDGPLAAGDRLVWHRPPWQEAAVPVLPSPLFDDGDLVVFNKPSGLQVLPAGGLLRHTVLGQLEAQVAAGALEAAAGAPRPVHRLGRYTSGLLVCARSAEARARLSAQLRDSTAQAHTGAAADGPAKIYRALLDPPVSGSRLLQLDPGGSCTIDSPIGQRPHPRLGAIWCAALPDHCAVEDSPRPLPARSCITLRERRDGAWLVDVAIATGRPHQIRIHTAAAGAPLQGDPLYGPGGLARGDALPGDGGYRLHAWRLALQRPDGSLLQLLAPLPAALRGADDGPDL